MKVINRFKLNSKVTSFKRKIKKDANIYTAKTMPLINMKGVSLSTPNAKILTNINLKVYEAEKVAFVDPENTGR